MSAAEAINREASLWSICAIVDEATFDVCQHQYANFALAGQNGQSGHLKGLAGAGLSNIGEKLVMCRAAFHSTESELVEDSEKSMVRLHGRFLTDFASMISPPSFFSPAKTR